MSWRLLWCHSLAVGGTAVSGRWDCVGLLLMWVFWVSDLVGLRRLGFGDQEESEGRGYPCIHSSTVDRLPCCFLTLSSFGLASLRVSQSDEDLAGSLSGAPKLSSKFPEMQHGPGTLRIWKAALRLGYSTLSGANLRSPGLKIKGCFHRLGLARVWSRLRARAHSQKTTKTNKRTNRKSKHQIVGRLCPSSWSLRC